MQPTGKKRNVWMCNTRYKTKGVKGCNTGHVDEKILMQVFNTLIDNKQYFSIGWK